MLELFNYTPYLSTMIINIIIDHFITMKTTYQSAMLNSHTWELDHLSGINSNHRKFQQGNGHTRSFNSRIYHLNQINTYGLDGCLWKFQVSSILWDLENVGEALFYSIICIEMPYNHYSNIFLFPLEWVREPNYVSLTKSQKSIWFGILNL